MGAGAAEREGAGEGDGEWARAAPPSLCWNSGGSVKGGSWLPAEVSRLLIGGCGKGTPTVLGEADLPAEMCAKFALGVRLIVA